jgi:hypothetical protein
MSAPARRAIAGLPPGPSPAAAARLQPGRPRTHPLQCVCSSPRSAARKAAPASRTAPVAKALPMEVAQLAGEGAFIGGVALTMCAITLVVRVTGTAWQGGDRGRKECKIMRAMPCADADDAPRARRCRQGWPGKLAPTTLGPGGLVDWQ